MLLSPFVLVALLALFSCAYAAEGPKIGGDVARAVIEHTVEGLHKLRPAQAHDSKRKLLWTPGNGLTDFQNFMKDFYGRNWSQYVPQAWTNPNFGWDRLGAFDYTSNMRDFVDAIYANNVTMPQSLKDVHDNMEEVTSIFCTPEEFTPSEVVYATCVGPSVTLAYVPKVCVLDEVTKEIACDPAKIVLSKAPGGCTHKYHSAASWVGKECKISGKAGFTQELTYGGANYTIPLSFISWGWETNPSP